MFNHSEQRFNKYATRTATLYWDSNSVGKENRKTSKTFSCSMYHCNGERREKRIFSVSVGNRQIWHEVRCFVSNGRTKFLSDSFAFRGFFVPLPSREAAKHDRAFSWNEITLFLLVPNGSLRGCTLGEHTSRRIIPRWPLKDWMMLNKNNFFSNTCFFNFLLFHFQFFSGHPI